MHATAIEDFKRAMRLLPASVTVIATGEAPQRSGLTATAVCSLSAEPPQILACLNARSGTAARILQLGTFSVNILDSGHHALAKHFAGATGAAGEDRFAFGAWDRGEHSLPVLQDAVVALECRLVEAVPSATHFIMIGQVLGLHVETPRQTLIYRDGEFGIWTALGS